MLREARVLSAPELDVEHSAIDVRVPFLRVGLHVGKNVSSDFGVMDRAAPFVHRMSRPCVTLVLEGRGRFDESGAHVALSPGDLAVSDQRAGGTEAYAGARSRTLVLDWDPTVIGASHARGFEVVRVGAVDRARLAAAADALVGAQPEDACAEILRVLRALGLPFAPIEANDLRVPIPQHEAQLARAVGAHLSRLRTHPAIDDVVDELGWNARLVHRRVASISARYGIPWDHWRSMLHHYRLLTALRLLAAPGATTELVARLAGFRSAQSLCHTFAKAGLPSPGVFAQAARRDPTEGWADLGEKPSVRAA